jgi:transcriptional regulator with XRE-family HTH domain
MPPIKKPQRQRLKHFIKEWRDYRGLTQEQVADRIGISPTTFGRIEGSKVPYNQDFLELAADALRCEPWDLLHRDPNKEGDVVDLMRHLSDRQREEAAEYIRFLAQKKA